MSGHTPGPWKIVPRSRAEDGGAYPTEIVSDDEREFHITPLEAGVIAQLALDNPGSFWGDSDVKKANARLIAAAPRLLEALINMEAEKSDYMRINKLGDPSREETNKQARAAIADATGSTK